MAAGTGGTRTVGSSVRQAQRTVSALEAAADMILAAHPEPTPEPMVGAYNPYDPAHGDPEERHATDRIGALTIDRWERSEDARLFWTGLQASNGNLSKRGGDIIAGTAPALNVRASDTGKRARVHAIARMAADPLTPWLTPYGTMVALGSHTVRHGNGERSFIWITPLTADRKTTAVRSNGTKGGRPRSCGHTASDGYVRNCDKCRAAERKDRSRKAKAARETAARKAAQQLEQLQTVAAFDRLRSSMWQ